MFDKQCIRKQINEKRKELSEEFISINSRVIADKLYSTDLYKNAECIYIYMNIAGEVSTKEIIQEALLQGKKVAIPKIVNKAMCFYYIKTC